MTSPLNGRRKGGSVPVAGMMRKRDRLPSPESEMALVPNAKPQCNINHQKILFTKILFTKKQKILFTKKLFTKMDFNSYM